MSATRVIALGIGWIVMLAGSLACVGAGVFVIVLTAGADFGPAWTGTLLLAGIGFGLMVGAVPLMFFGCEARQDIRANRAAACTPVFKLAPVAQRVPEMALAMPHAGRHLSSFAVGTLEHRR